MELFQEFHLKFHLESFQLPTTVVSSGVPPENPFAVPRGVLTGVPSEALPVVSVGVPLGVLSGINPGVPPRIHQ